jgi:hypothetical protein
MKKPGISLYTQANMLGFSPFRERPGKEEGSVIVNRSTNTSFFQDVQFFVRWYSPCDHFIVEKFP